MLPLSRYSTYFLNRQFSNPIEEKSGLYITSDYSDTYTEQHELLKKALEIVKCTNKEVFNFLNSVSIPVPISLGIVATEADRKKFMAWKEANQREFEQVGTYYEKYGKGTSFSHATGETKPEHTFDKYDECYKARIRSGFNVTERDKNQEIVSGVFTRYFKEDEYAEIKANYLSQHPNSTPEEQDTAFYTEIRKGIEVTAKEIDDENLCETYKITITLDYETNTSLKEFATTLAHELGHAYHTFLKPAENELWGRMSIDKWKGHDLNNPSGIEAEKQGTLCKSNYEKCKYSVK